MEQTNGLEGFILAGSQDGDPRKRIERIWRNYFRGFTKTQPPIVVPAQFLVPSLPSCVLPAQHQYSSFFIIIHQKRG
jgi:hypothetical protein